MQEKLLRVILCLFKSLASVWGNYRRVEVFVLRVWKLGYLRLMIGKGTIKYDMLPTDFNLGYLGVMGAHKL